MRRFLFAVTILFIPLASAYAIHLESLDLKGGMIWIGNAPVDEDQKDAAPSPLTTITGLSLPIRFTSFFSLAPELRYYGLPYGVEYGRPVPVEVEFAHWVWVVGLLLEPRARIDLQITQPLSLSAYISPTFLFRIPARRWGTVDRREIAAYQYGMGRFFYPAIGLIVDYELPFRIQSGQAESLNEGEFSEPEPYEGISIHVILDLNAYFPLFHAWDGENLKFYDQLMASGTVGVRFFLPRPQQEKQPEISAR